MALLELVFLLLLKIAKAFYMKTNLTEIVKLLEREKCLTHRYRALVYIEKEEIKINACCDSFKHYLEETSHQLIERELYHLSEV